MLTSVHKVEILTVSTKLCTKHPWVMGIQFCSNEGSCPFPRGDNYEKVKNTLMKF